MRINIYHHELAHMKRCELINKSADTGTVFFGLRFYLEPPLMHQPNDDDSSALTLWMPWKKKGGQETRNMRRIAADIIRMCDEVDGWDAANS